MFFRLGRAQIKRIFVRAMIPRESQDVSGKASGSWLFFAVRTGRRFGEARRSQRGAKFVGHPALCPIYNYQIPDHTSYSVSTRSKP